MKKSKVTPNTAERKFYDGYISSLETTPVPFDLNQRFDIYKQQIAHDFNQLRKDITQQGTEVAVNFKQDIKEQPVQQPESKSKLEIQPQTNNEEMKTRKKEVTFSTQQEPQEPHTPRDNDPELPKSSFTKSPAKLPSDSNVTQTSSLESLTRGSFANTTWLETSATETKKSPRAGTSKEKSSKSPRISALLALDTTSSSTGSSSKITANTDSSLHEPELKKDAKLVLETEKESFVKMSAVPKKEVSFADLARKPPKPKPQKSVGSHHKDNGQDQTKKNGQTSSKFSLGGIFSKLTGKSNKSKQAFSDSSSSSDIEGVLTQKEKRELKQFIRKHPPPKLVKIFTVLTKDIENTFSSLVSNKSLTFSQKMSLRYPYDPIAKATTLKKRLNVIKYVHFKQVLTEIVM